MLITIQLTIGKKIESLLPSKKISPGSLPKGNLDINGYKKDNNKNVNPNINNIFCIFLIGYLFLFLLRLQRSLQYKTLSQSFLHFFLHEKGLLQVLQIFSCFNI